MNLQLKHAVAVERIELIARLVTEHAINLRARDREVAISLIDEILACVRADNEGSDWGKNRKIALACPCCIKMHE
ncbi:hypothetical protein [Serratia fonticola]|uniref:hypothetical protein n=1 Tax=Serratia fonticola TaxID=47917 RepID=UPI000E0FC51D|nr:hypothetical protein [Serratia fonticola]